jgi:hypothetical protein
MLLVNVRKICHVTMDSNDEPALHVHRLYGSVMKFVEHESCLCVYNPNAMNKRVTGNFICPQLLGKKLFRAAKSKQPTQFGTYSAKLGDLMRPSLTRSFARISSEIVLSGRATRSAP